MWRWTSVSFTEKLSQGKAEKFQWTDEKTGGVGQKRGSNSKQRHSDPKFKNTSGNYWEEWKLFFRSTTSVCLLWSVDVSNMQGYRSLNCQIIN